MTHLLAMPYNQYPDNQTTTSIVMDPNSGGARVSRARGIDHFWTSSSSPPLPLPPLPPLKVGALEVGPFKPS